VALTNNDFNSLNFQQGAGGNATAVSIADIRNTNNNISLLNNPYSQFSDDIEAEFWENGFLWACPLH